MALVVILFFPPSNKQPEAIQLSGGSFFSPPTKTGLSPESFSRFGGKKAD